MHPVVVLGLLAGCAWPGGAGVLRCGCLAGGMEARAVLLDGGLELLALARRLIADSMVFASFATAFRGCWPSRLGDTCGGCSVC